MLSFHIFCNSESKYYVKSCTEMFQQYITGGTTTYPPYPGNRQRIYCCVIIEIVDYQEHDNVMFDVTFFYTYSLDSSSFAGLAIGIVWYVLADFKLP